MTPQRVSLITLGVADLAAARGFYAALGWVEADASPSVAFFQMQGQVLGLFGRADLASDQGWTAAALGTGAVTLAQSFASVAEVDAAFSAALAAGGTALKSPEKVFWGGYSGYWADPDGHVWEVAMNPFWSLLPDGRLMLPGQIGKINEMEMTQAEEAQIVALLVQCFDTDFGGRSFYRTRHHLRLVIREAGQIVAHVAVQFRAVRLGGRLVDVAALAEVATHPDHRGRGLAGRLVQVAIAEARRARAEFALLFGTADLYAAAGFERTGNPMIFVQMDGARTGEIMRQPANELRVLSLGDGIWDQAADLDVLGGLF
jgi:predicted N-acetyltransferase YhbS/predicted lactoylglutathione lyase